MKARLDICVVIDNSASINGDRLDKLWNGLRHFLDKIKVIGESNPLHLSLVYYSGFTPILIDEEHSHLISTDSIPLFQLPFLNQTMEMALHHLLTNRDTASHKPWLIVLSDWRSIESELPILKEIIANEKSNSVFYLPFMLSNDNLIEDNFAPVIGSKKAIRILANRYDEMFSWLIKMIQLRLATTTDASLKLDRKDLEGWTIL